MLNRRVKVMAAAGTLFDGVGRRLGKGTLGNITALYGSLAVYYVLPLATIPYLFRVLGVATWGTIAMAQGFGSYLFLIVDYAFGLSATRDVARNIDSPERVEEIFAGVIGAKGILTAACLAAAFCVGLWVPAMHANPLIFWSAVAVGLAMGLHPLWFFLGSERLQTVAGIDIVAKVLAAGGVFVWVHGPADAWRVVALQAAGATFSTVAGMFVAYRRISFRMPTAPHIMEALRGGWTMFLMRSSGLLYTAGNAFLLGLFAPGEAVGYFAGAEKVSRAFVGILNPFNQAMYPRMTKLVAESPDKARRLFRVNAAVLAGGGVTISLILCAGASFVVRIVLGPGQESAVPILRLLSLLPALVGINLLLGNQWMLPHGLEATLNRIYLRAAALNLVLAFVLAPRFGALGMACSVLSAEFFTIAACALDLYRSKMRLPFRAGAVSAMPAAPE